MKDLIAQLGGPTAVAKALGIAVSRVGNWTTRGVPWRFRAKLARMAHEAGIRLPENFSDSEAA